MTPAKAKKLTEAEISALPRMSLTDLEKRAHPQNPKLHNIAQLATAMNRWGYTNPVLIDERTGYIAAGHGRIAALRLMKDRGDEAPKCITTEAGGIDWFVPVSRGWSSVDDDELLLYLVEDNQSTMMGGWDPTLLPEILARAGNTELGVAGLGFSHDDIQLLIDKAAADATPANPDDMENIPLPENPVTERGDVWEIGPHKIMCGDCRDAADVSKLVENETINVAVTSPPYAEQRKYDEKSEFQPVAPDEYVEWFKPVSDNVAAHLAEDGSFFVNIKPAAAGLDTLLYVHDLVAAHVRQWGWHFATEFCWERVGVPKHVSARFKNQFEPIYQFVRDKWKIRPDNVAFASKDAIIPVGRTDADTDFEHMQGSGRGAILPEQSVKNRSRDMSARGEQAVVQGTGSEGPPKQGRRARQGVGGWNGPTYYNEADDSRRARRRGNPGRGDTSWNPDRKAKAAGGALGSVQGQGRRRGRPAGNRVPSSERQHFTPGDHEKRQGNGQVLFPPESKASHGGYNGTASDVQGSYSAVEGANVGLGWAYPGNRLPTLTHTHEAVGHSAAFPVGLPMFFVLAYSDEGDCIYDPFVGSGSTVLAAHACERVGLGLELSPRYCDMALARIQRVTGLIPTRNGVPHDFWAEVDQSDDRVPASDSRGTE